MKASELIQKLQAHIEEHGDQEVLCTDESWTLPIDHVSLIENACIEQFGPYTEPDDQYTLDYAFMIETE